MKHGIGVKALLAVLVVLAAGGCVSKVGPGVKVEVEAQEIVRSSVRYQKQYVLFPGDQIEIAVWRVPEVSRTVVVRPDGFISLPLLQEVKAAGLTPAELAASITAAYANRLVKPEVTVIPTQIRQPMVYVLGDVRAPGAFPARNAVTVAQALALAGGALRTADESQIRVIRLSEDGYLEAIPLGGGNPLSQDQPYILAATALLKTDDVVFVPESGRAQVSRALNELLVPIQIIANYKLIESLNN